MDDKPISGKDFLTFMNDFKTTMEKTVKNIDRKLDAKMNKIDEDIKDLRDEVKANDKKTDDMNNFLTGRMSRLEQDLKRMHHSRMKSDTLGTKPSEKEVDAEIPIPTGWKDNGELGITRHNSWADEVAKELDAVPDKTSKLKDKQHETDRRQWLEKRTTPTCWTEDVEVIASPEKTEKTEKIDKNNEKTDKNKEKQKRQAVNHWFGYEQDESEDDDTSEEENEKDWNTVNRKEKKQLKEARNRKKRKQKMEETARKAQFMVGIGPISEKCFNDNTEKEQELREG